MCLCTSLSLPFFLGFHRSPVCLFTASHVPYRCAFSAPRVQKEVYFNPRSETTGQSGQIQAFSFAIHVKLPPTAQKKISFASFAHLLYVGHEPQMHIPLAFTMAAAISAGGMLCIFFSISSNLSIYTPPFRIGSSRSDRAVFVLPRYLHSLSDRAGRTEKLQEIIFLSRLSRMSFFEITPETTRAP